MIVNLREATRRVQVTRDFVAVQRFFGTHWVLGTGSVILTPGQGLGVAGASTIFGALEVGGLPDVTITTQCKWIAPSTPAAHDMGVILRLQTTQGADDTYMYACVRNGNAEIRRVYDSAFSTLFSTPFAVPASELMTITFSVVYDPVGLTDDFEATFSSATPGTVVGSVSEPLLVARGYGGCGIRTQNSAGYFERVTMEQA